MRPNLRRPDPQFSVLGSQLDVILNRLIFKHYFLIGLFCDCLLQIGFANTYMLGQETRRCPNIFDFAE